jgi:DNA-directed RNA polymerase subunit M/transcription elongation factor TFIIS
MEGILVDLDKSLPFIKNGDIFPERYSVMMDACRAIEMKYSKPLTLDERPDGAFKCGKCRSWKTEYTEQQTRSADEPTTKKVYCHACQNRWKFC